MEINVRYLKAMLLFAAKRDVRFYLNGILIQRDRMVATDGHRMLVCRLPADSGLNVIVPSEDLRIALMLPPANNTGLLGPMRDYRETIEVTADRIGRVSYTPIDGTYPDWQKVVPKKFEGGKIDQLAFNSAYMADYQKVGQLVGHSKVVHVVARQSEANAPILVHISGCDDFFSLLMPVRLTDSKPIPDWLATLPLP